MYCIHVIGRHEGPTWEECSEVKHCKSILCLWTESKVQKKFFPVVDLEVFWFFSFPTAVESSDVFMNNS